MGENGNRGREVMGKWEWECSVGMGMGGNGNENDLMGVGSEWEQESHSGTPLIYYNTNTKKTKRTYWRTLSSSFSVLVARSQTP